MGDIESPSHQTNAMPITEVSFIELLMVAMIVVPFLVILTIAEGGKGPGPSVRNLRIKKFR